MTLSKLETGLIIALAAVIIVASVTILSITYKISNVGKIKAVGIAVFWDLNASNSCTSIDWGLLKPGDLAGVTVYIKNVKNSNVTLSLNVTNWSPQNASAYLTLSWNYSNTILQPAQIIPTQITLLVSPQIQNIDTFSFDINITATEA
jgi:hypothetical protein